MNAIVAVSENWGIGKDNALLFHIRADLQRFKALTTGHTVVMGRRTLESLPGGRGLAGAAEPRAFDAAGLCPAERREVVRSLDEAARRRGRRTPSSSGARRSIARCSRGVSACM